MLGSWGSSVSAGPGGAVPPLPASAVSGLWAHPVGFQAGSLGPASPCRLHRLWGLCHGGRSLVWCLEQGCGIQVLTGLVELAGALGFQGPVPGRVQVRDQGLRGYTQCLEVAGSASYG